MTTICAETVNCNNLVASNNKATDKIGVLAKVTFDNVNNTNASSFLKHAGFFQVIWPANFFIMDIVINITGNNIVMGNTDDTILCIADGTNAITGTSTNIVMNQPYGSTTSTNEVIYTNNTQRQLLSLSGVNTFSSYLKSEERTLTGVIFHDADGVTDGNGDGATHVSGLDTAVMSIIIEGVRVPN